MGELLPVFNLLYGILRDRPDLLFTALLMMGYVMERAERKDSQKKNFELVERMHEQSKDTNELLGNIRFLLEIITKGRK
jgi:hypothetical protein